jgi:hypothetical protein
MHHYIFSSVSAQPNYVAFKKVNEMKKEIDILDAVNITILKLLLLFTLRSVA